MFWKKKKTIELELDARHADNRAAYRIAPDRSRPVIVAIDGNAIHAVNVSGTGIAFRAPDFEVGKRFRATIRLPSEEKVFTVVLKVVARQDDLCRCFFHEIHEDSQNLLHSYILDLQKRKIRQNQRQR